MALRKGLVIAEEVRPCCGGRLKPQSELLYSISFNHGKYASGLKAAKQSYLGLFVSNRLISFSGALFGLSTLLFSALPAHALSATSAQTIVGTEPYLLLSDGVTKLTNLNELLGFSMPKQDGSSGTEQIDASMQGTTIIAPPGMKYSDVVALVTADGSPYSVSGLTGLLVDDDDGDASVVANTSVGGELKATWYDGVTQITNLNQTLSSSCDGVSSYTLKIEVPTALSANATYGAPNTKSYGSATATYTFLSAEICYLQPGSMKINTGTAGVDIKYAAGYNPDVWEYDSSLPAAQRHRGFKVDSGFPTTGFYKAVFSLIGSGSDQSKYRCSSTDDDGNGTGKIILSGAASSSLGANCKVTYNSLTRAAFTAGGTPTINMEYNNGSTWVQIDSYPIPTPVLWALPQTTTYAYGNTTSLASSTSFPALDRCRVAVGHSAIPATTWQQAAGQNPADRTFRQTYMYRRDELTNSPYADRTAYPEGSSPSIGGFYSRDVDGTFMGEWGSVYDSYSGSGWAGDPYYWTAEADSTSYQFYVYTHGYVTRYDPNGSNLVAVCRG